MTALPEAYLNRMKELLKADYDAYVRSLSEERAFGLRVNSRKICPEAFCKISPFSLDRVPWTETGFYYDPEEKPAKHPYYYAGLYYLQEPSAMTSAELLPVSEGDTVLDLCAAPGGKSTALAEKLHGTGLLVSNDISASRCKALLKNLELFGTENAVVTAEDPKRLAEKFPECFDKILLDAPCSGEGMFRKDPSVVKSYLEHGNEFYESLQRSIIGSAVRLLKPGGLLLYSTCTFSPGENEAALLYALSLDERIEIADFAEVWPEFDRGFTDLPGMECEDLKKAVRLFPHHVRGEGHFVALLKKKGETSVRAVPEPVSLAEIPGFSALKPEVREFLSRIRKRFCGGVFSARGEYLSLSVSSSLDFSGLRVLRNGLLLGEQKSGRFEPSEALAMALSFEDFDNVISFPADAPEVIKYLKGETVTVPDGTGCKDGYVIIAADRFPLGFAKAKGNVLKNKYLPGWRYQ